MARRPTRRPLIDAEREARRRADRERVEQAARELPTSEGWRRWIRVRATNGLSRYTAVISGRLHQTGHPAEQRLDDMSSRRHRPIP
jgi:hypothetical protein